jgi:uncharacterized membrane protein YeiH
VLSAYLLEHASVIFSAMAGVLAARGKNVDLFGVIVLGLVNAVGGGTLRDVMLDAPVFWVRDANFVLSSTFAAVTMFFLARVAHPDPKWLLLPDALGLALVTMLGTAKAAQLGHATSVCVVMGVTTGVAGGVLRDVLCGEIPLVFRKNIYLYATAAALGAGAYLAAKGLGAGEAIALTIGAGVVLILRWLAVRRRIGLPEFRLSSDGHVPTNE